jgi:hypothetical protein
MFGDAPQLKNLKTRRQVRCSMSICKIYVGVPEGRSQGFVTLKFEENEDVGSALWKVAGKLKFTLTKEEVVEKYALIIQGAPQIKYLPVDRPILEFLTPEILKVRLDTDYITSNTYNHLTYSHFDMIYIFGLDHLNVE